MTQQMRDMPLLQSTNSFGCLEVEECDNDSPELLEDMSENQKNPIIINSDSTLQVEKKARVPKWERKLPKKFVLASTPSSRSFQIPVQLQTTDTQEVKAAKALLDCGASDLFLDIAYVKREGLNTRKLTNPIPVNNVDGTPNEAGPISEIVDMILCYKDHMERVTFAITSLRGQDAILGLPWL